MRLYNSSLFQFVMNSSLENKWPSGWLKNQKRMFKVNSVPKSDNKNRHVTDAYWCGLFIVIFISWIAAWQHVTHHETHFNNVLADEGTVQLVYQEQHDNIISENSTAVKDTSEMFHHKNANNETATKEIEVLLSDLLSLHKDLFTFNPSRLADKSPFYPMIPLFHLFWSGTNLLMSAYILYMIPSAVAFLFICLIEHLSLMYHSSHSVAIPLFGYHEKLAGWVIPETLFLIIWLRRTFFRVDSGKSQDPRATVTQNRSGCRSVNVADDGSSDSLKNNSDDDNFNNDSADNFDDRDNKEELPFPSYIYAVIFGFPFIVILKILLTTTTAALYKIGWDSRYSYIIAGGSCYVGLTIYYFGLMLTACATDIMIDKKNFFLTDFLRALFIVSRYHFGTACYHATLIFPRLRATFVMNETELKISTGYPSVRGRLYATHCRVYSYSRTLTATRGHNHPDSIRELLCVFSRIKKKNTYLRDYDLIFFMLLLIFLLASNSLMIMLLLYLGADDPDFSEASRMMYLTMMLIYKLIMPFFRTVSDTIGLRLCVESK